MATTTRFEMTPLATTFDDQGPTVDGRRFVPVCGMPMYGLLLLELCPDHAVRVPFSALPSPAPRWADTEGETTPLPGLVDADVLQACNESMRSDLAAIGITSLPAEDELWCVERLSHGTYTTRFSEELDRRRGAAPRPATDHASIAVIARMLFSS